jgi:asparagine synthase (glutamine-hydrolysing)
MSGGLDSPLVALTAKRALQRTFAAPELRAYCEVYDHLIPDDERRYAGLAAQHLGIPIDFQPGDEAVPIDWAGRLAPPQPPTDFVVGPTLDQLARAASHARVILTGYDGDTLLEAPLRLHWRERLARGQLAKLGRELAWFVRTQRTLPPVGVRTALARRRDARASVDRPRWVREDFWARTGLAERGRRELLWPGATRAREASVLAFQRPAWGALFDGYDPAYLGRPIDVRHPFLDLRLIRFALRLPVFPWCVNKHLLRRCVEELPAALRRRPKTPLAADPVTRLLSQRGPGALPSPSPSDELDRFLDARELQAAIDGRAWEDDPWPLLRALTFATWLERRPPTPGAVAP